MHTKNSSIGPVANQRVARQSRIGMSLLLSLSPLVALAAGETPPAPAAEPTATAAPSAGEAVPWNPVLQDNFRFTVGGFYASTNTNAALEPSAGGVGVGINFENALGLPNRRLVAEGAMYWRFAKRWRLDVNYFGIARRATRTLSQDIQWGDYTFTAGTEVNSSFRLSDLRASVGYSFFRTTDKEVGVGLGLHAAGMRANIDASGIGAEAGDVTAPLPVLSFYANFALTDQWAMTTRADFLSLEYSDYKGELRSIALDVVYQPFRNLGFGFGWHSLITNLTVNKTDWAGQVVVAYQGPSGYVSFSF
jgi:hypothetical protein